MAEDPGRRLTRLRRRELAAAAQRPIKNEAGKLGPLPTGASDTPQDSHARPSNAASIEGELELVGRPSNVKVQKGHAKHELIDQTLSQKARQSAWGGEGHAKRELVDQTPSTAAPQSAFSGEEVKQEMSKAPCGEKLTLSKAPCGEKRLEAEPQAAQDEDLQQAPPAIKPELKAEVKEERGGDAEVSDSLVKQEAIAPNQDAVAKLELLEEDKQEAELRNPKAEAVKSEASVKFELPDLDVVGGAEEVGGGASSSEKASQGVPRQEGFGRGKKSGISGVSWIKKESAWRVTWKLHNGRIKTRSFKVARYMHVGNKQQAENVCWQAALSFREALKQQGWIKEVGAPSPGLDTPASGKRQQPRPTEGNWERHDEHEGEPLGAPQAMPSSREDLSAHASGLSWQPEAQQLQKMRRFSAPHAEQQHSGNVYVQQTREELLGDKAWLHKGSQAAHERMARVRASRQAQPRDPTLNIVKSRSGRRRPLMVQDAEVEMLNNVQVDAQQRQSRSGRRRPPMLQDAEARPQQQLALQMRGQPLGQQDAEARPQQPLALQMRGQPLGLQDAEARPQQQLALQMRAQPLGQQGAEVSRSSRSGVRVPSGNPRKVPAVSGVKYVYWEKRGNHWYVQMKFNEGRREEMQRFRPGDTSADAIQRSLVEAIQWRNVVLHKRGYIERLKDCTLGMMGEDGGEGEAPRLEILHHRDLACQVSQGGSRGSRSLESQLPDLADVQDCNIGSRQWRQAAQEEMESGFARLARLAGLAGFAGFGGTTHLAVAPFRWRLPRAGQAPIRILRQPDPPLAAPWELLPSRPLVTSTCNITWKQSENAWRVRWRNHRGIRTSRSFGVHRFWQDRRTTFEEACSASFQAAAAFRAELVSQGLLTDPQSLAVEGRRALTAGDSSGVQRLEDRQGRRERAEGQPAPMLALPQPELPQPAQDSAVYSAQRIGRDDLVKQAEPVKRDMEGEPIKRDLNEEQVKRDKDGVKREHPDLVAAGAGDSQPSTSPLKREQSALETSLEEPPQVFKPECKVLPQIKREHTQDNFRGLAADASRSPEEVRSRPAAVEDAPSAPPPDDLFSLGPVQRSRSGRFMRRHHEDPDKETCKFERKIPVKRLKSEPVEEEEEARTAASPSNAGEPGDLFTMDSALSRRTAPPSPVVGSAKLSRRVVARLKEEQRETNWADRQDGRKLPYGTVGAKLKLEAKVQAKQPSKRPRLDNRARPSSGGHSGVKPASGVKYVYWERGYWRVHVKLATIQEDKKFKPADTSAAAIERSRLEAVGWRERIFRDHEERDASR